MIQDGRVFAERGYPNLFTMLIKEYKLSETSANQRIKALELLAVVPKAEESLVSGELNLTTLALAQRQIKQEEKITGEKVNVSKKIEIIDRIKNKTQNETEIELMRLLPNTVSSPKIHKRRVSEDTIRVSLNIPDRVMEKMKRLQDLWAHSNPSMDYIEIIEKSIDETLKRMDPLLKKIHRSVARDVARARDKKRLNYYSVQTRQELWKKADSSCEFVDEQTDRRCSSRFALEIDHSTPLAMGGTNDISNLRLLCQVHNGLMARRWFGDEKIDREIHKKI